MSKFAEGIRGEIAEGKERGKNTHIVFSFTRHEKPGKTPEGMSADFILPEGLEKMKNTGREEQCAQYIIVFGSKGVNRARETGRAYITGVQEDGEAEVINKEGVEGSKLKEFGVYVSEELDPVKNAGNALKPILAEGKKKVEAGELQAGELEGWAIARFMELSDEEFRKLGVPNPQETAERLAHRLMSGIKMSKRLVEGIDTKVNNFTHGPNLECLLKFLIVQDGLVGYDDLSEIGGAFAPGGSINFDIRRDENGELKPVTVEFRGQRYEIDMAALKNMAEAYKTRREEEKRKRQEAAEAGKNK